MVVTDEHVTRVTLKREGGHLLVQQASEMDALRTSTKRAGDEAVRFATSERKVETAIRSATIQAASLGSALGGTKDGFQLAATGVGFLSNAFGALTGPVGIAILLIGTITEGILRYSASNEDARKKQEAATKALEDHNAAVEAYRNRLAKVATSELEHQKAILEKQKAQAEDIGAIGQREDAVARLADIGRELERRFHGNLSEIADSLIEIRMLSGEAFVPLEFAADAVGMKFGQLLPKMAAAKDATKGMRTEAEMLAAAEAALAEGNTARWKELLTVLGLVRAQKAQTAADDAVETAKQAARTQYLTATSLAALQEIGQGHEALFEVARVASAAQALVNSYEAASKAWAQGGIFGAITAGLVWTGAFANVAAIYGVSPGASGGGAPPRGGGTALPSFGSTGSQPAAGGRAAGYEGGSSTGGFAGSGMTAHFVFQNAVTRDFVRDVFDLAKRYGFTAPYAQGQTIRVAGG